jgi:hypothetical protein
MQLSQYLSPAKKTKLHTTFPDFLSSTYEKKKGGMEDILFFLGSTQRSPNNNRPRMDSNKGGENQ